MQGEKTVFSLDTITAVIFTFCVVDQNPVVQCFLMEKVSSSRKIIK